jgi:hypothetical protein
MQHFPVNEFLRSEPRKIGGFSPLSFDFGLLDTL